MCGHRHSKVLVCAATALLVASCADGPCPALPDGGPAPQPDTRVPDLRPADASLPAVPGWTVTAGGTGYEGINELLLDGSGNLIMSGWFEGTLTLGASTLASTKLALFIAKLDQTGKFLWAVQLPGETAGRNGLVVDGAGNVYFSAAFKNVVSVGFTILTSSGDNDFFIVKISPAGSVEWAVRGGGPLPDGTPLLALDGSGQIVVVGAFGVTTQLGAFTLTTSSPNSGALYIAKLDPAGSFVSAAVAAESEKPGSLQHLVVDGAGNLYLTGSYAGTMRIGSTTLAPLSADVPQTAFVAKLDATAKGVWVTPVFTGQSRTLLLDRAGNVYAGGSWFFVKAGNGNPVVAKLDPDGMLIWTKSAVASNHTDVSSIVAGEDGDLAIMGAFSGTTLLGPRPLTSVGGPFGQSDIFLARIGAPWSTVVWTGQVGGPGGEVPGGLVRDKDGWFYVAGAFEKTVTIGGSKLTSKGDKDLFVWKTRGFAPH